MSLSSFASSVDDVLHPVDQLDVLLLYGLVAGANQPYLGDRELAAKVHISDGPTLLKRGSDREPLTADELGSAVDEAFLRTRNDVEDLEAARDELTDVQAKVWQYFIPRKHSEFLYATNFEGEGNPIDRIFFDIDRGADVSAEDARAVTRAFVEFLDDDAVTQDVVESTVISFTGNSFHVDLLLESAQPPEFYQDEVFTTTSRQVDTMTERGVDAVSDAVDVPVVGGHEKRAGVVNVDPSQTPSGKLNRVPLGSLHLADAETVDGVSVPVTRDELADDDLVDRLTSYTPDSVVDELDALAEKLP